MQQTGTIQLVKRRKQLAQRKIAQGAEQGKSGGFYGDAWHGLSTSMVSE